MNSNPFLGVLLHAIGGLAAASFYIPYRRVRNWSWESYWLVGGLFSWIIAPWVVARINVPDVLSVLADAPPRNLLLCFVFGALWGTGGLTFGLSMRYLGMSLGYALALGFCAAFGTLIPPLVGGQLVEIVDTWSGLTTLVGVATCLAGIAVCGCAGMAKEKELSAEQKRETIREFHFTRGLWVALFAGVMSACMAYGIAAGKPIAALAVTRGTAPLWQNTPVFIVIFAGGFSVNLVWCGLLNLRNRSAGDYVAAGRAPLLTNYLFSAVAGITWYLQFMFYGMGTSKMGKYDFSSWTIHMAFIIVFSNLWGIHFHEWRGVRRKTMEMVWFGIGMLILSTCVVGLGNYLAGADTGDTGGGPLVIGPYVQNVGHDRATVCWATLEGSAKIAGPGGETTIPRYKVHELLLANREPNTTYQYDAFGDGADAGKGSFTTFPQEIAPFRFAVVGDTRSNHEVHKAIVNRMLAVEPRFVVNTGDLVSDGRNIDDWMAFFRINRDLMGRIPYFPILGNHENDAPYYFDFFCLPGHERYYMFTVGEVLLLCLDAEGYSHDTPAYMDDDARRTWVTCQNLDYMKRQKEWVENMLTLNDSAGYIFVFVHEPLISVKRSRVEDAKQRRAFWDGVFERHRVNVVFAGHDHHYHRALVGSTHHITTAGGGAGLYDPDTPAPETVIVKKVHHFCRVDIGDKAAKVTAIEITGDVIEQVALARRH